MKSLSSLRRFVRSKRVYPQRTRQNSVDSRDYFRQVGLYDRLSAGTGNGEIEPDYDDLRFLHEAVARSQKRRDLTVLEFGVGFSTLVFAHAISMLPNAQREKSQLHSLDTSAHWIDLTREKLPGELTGYVTFHHSQASAVSLDGQFCSLYDHLPNVRPNIIYLDGPDPVEVQGTVRGLAFVTSAGKPNPPIAADLLTYEWLLERGSKLIVDGRNANARFLARNFRRTWSYTHDAEGDRHIFNLDA
ncbi:MAG TPA: hypothetical protein VGU45_17440 [Microvirga sp.]|jgi:hypothetical protein|nr:hypothetical protein [Microvirga sp.]